MRISRNKVTGLVLIIIFLIFALVAFYDRMIIYLFAANNNLNISYKNLTRVSLNEIAFNDLSVVEKKTGIGFFAKYSRVKSLGKGIQPPQYAAIDLDLKDVNFIKKETEKNMSYDSLSGLVSIPFDSHWKYREIRGQIWALKNEVKVKDLMTTSDEIKLLLGGRLNYDTNKLESDIKIYFSEQLTKKIPEELLKVLLVDEKDGWKSLSVRLAGDYKTPSIQVSGKLFRLKINTISDAKEPSEIAF